MKSTKKGVGAFGAIGIAVLATIILIIVLVFSKNVMDSAEQVGRVETCKRSVEFASIKLNSELGDLTNIYGNKVDLECSTEYINYNLEEPEAAKEIIADKMVECWDMYGRGEKEIFDTKDNTFCVVCSRLTFSEEFEMNDFPLFLKENVAPFKGGKTYEEYLIKTDEINYEAVELNPGMEETMIIDYPVAIMFIMDKDAYPGSPVEAGKIMSTPIGIGAGIIGGLALCVTGVGCGPGIFILATAVGGTGGYLLGSDTSAEWDAKILMWDYEKLNELDCTYMESKSTPIKIIEK